MIVYRLLGDRAGAHAPGRLAVWRQALQALLMFHLVCVSWLLFRAESLGQAGAMFLKIVTDLRPTPLAVYGLGNLAFFAASWHWNSGSTGRATPLRDQGRLVLARGPLRVRRVDAAAVRAAGAS